MLFRSNGDRLNSSDIAFDRKNNYFIVSSQRHNGGKWYQMALGFGHTNSSENDYSQFNANINSDFLFDRVLYFNYINSLNNENYSDTIDNNYINVHKP